MQLNPSPWQGGRATSLPTLRSDRFASLLKPLLALLASALLLGAFAVIASHVIAGETRALDLRLTYTAYGWRLAYPWLAEALRDISALGSVTVLTLFTTATVVYLLLQGSRVTAVLVAASALGGTTLVSLLKSWVARMRPDAALADHAVAGLSFPSGHASMAAIVFLTVGALTASTRTRRRERFYILAMAGMLAFLVGASRVLLGVHWFTDVLGGWALGSAWAIAWLLIAFSIASDGSRSRARPATARGGPLPRPELPRSQP